MRKQGNRHRRIRMNDCQILAFIVIVLTACGYPPLDAVPGDTINAIDYALVVTKTGNGNGTVVSSPAGVICGFMCDQIYSSGTLVTLTALPDVDSIFTGWTGGGCNGVDACTVAISSTVAVIANFASQRQILTTTVSGDGGGIVTSTPAGIICSSECSKIYDYGVLVTLTATAVVDSTFVEWGDVCSNAGPCIFAMTTDRNITAIFMANHMITVVVQSDLGDSVSSSPGGIDCGADCTEIYATGTVVTLTAKKHLQGSRFSGWSGGDCSGNGTCTFTVTNDVTITASFYQD